jgi:ribosome biogenesis GTPase
MRCWATVQDTGGTRKGDGRGRHTTTSRSLHLAPGGACIIDTPGLRTLRLDSEAGDMAQVFDDIAQLAQQCRFRDCRHETSPAARCAAACRPSGCATSTSCCARRSATRMSALQRKEQLQVWKQRSKAARDVDRLKRGTT